MLALLFQIDAFMYDKDSHLETILSLPISFQTFLRKKSLFVVISTYIISSVMLFLALSYFILFKINIIVNFDIWNIIIS